MRILVTGKSGQLANCLVEKARQFPHVELLTAGRPQFDLTDPGSVGGTIAAIRPDVVISAAAYTAVDRAEDECVLARRVNAEGAEAVSAAANRVGAAIIHLSTDYVFSGDSETAYSEDDDTDPRTVYGQTKLEGERMVAKANPHHIILRTAWVYSPFGSNFVKTMLRLAAKQTSVTVVCDQWGNPSSALDLATAILQIATSDGASGTYHLVGSGQTNWANLAQYVFDVSRSRGGPFAEVIDIASADYPAKAKRPMNSRLCCAKARNAFGVEMPDWRSGVDEVVGRLVSVTCPA